MKQVETEFTIYAKVSNPKGLEQADAVEHHIQLEKSLGDKGRCRVRKTQGVGHEKIEFTLKSKTDDSGISHIEHTVPVDQDFMDCFEKVCDHKWDKTRYKFLTKSVTMTLEGSEDGKIELPEAIYEVDVFKKSDGEISEWCKIDVEVDKIQEFLKTKYPNLEKLRLMIKISHLAFKPIMPMNKMRSNPEVERRIDELYENEYKIPIDQTTQTE